MDDSLGSSRTQPIPYTCLPLLRRLAPSSHHLKLFPHASLHRRRVSFSFFFAASSFLSLFLFPPFFLFVCLFFFTKRNGGGGRKFSNFHVPRFKLFFLFQLCPISGYTRGRKLSHLVLKFLLLIHPHPHPPSVSFFIIVSILSLTISIFLCSRINLSTR